MEKKDVKYTIAFWITLALLKVGCSSASGPLFMEVSEIPSGQSVLYIYCPDQDGKTEFDIVCNGHEVGVLKRMTYIPVLIDAGKVEIQSSVRFKLFATGLLDKAIAGSTELVFKADVGQAYYIECLANQAGGQKLSLSLAPEKYGRIRIKQCHLEEE